MRIESKLCHLSDDKAVVQVNGWLDDKNVGSALAEGSTVELAEDKAISRLYKRLNTIDIKDNSITLKNDNKASLNKSKNIVNNEKLDLTKNGKNVTDNRKQEPSDWSNELTAIDLEIKRLNWSREDEVRYLEKNLGYNNRNKITKYSELINYLDILKKIENTNLSKSNTINIKAMIEESDLILKELSWNNKQGREYLKKEFDVLTRKELDEKQLISFVSKLKSIRNQSLSK